MNKKDMIEVLKTYLATRAEVVLAFIFGSVATEHAGKMSDVDVAVYLDKESDEIADSLQADLERLLKKEVDLVIMNRAPATVSWSAIRKGVPVKIQSRKFFLDFMLEVSTEAQDFMDFNLHAWRLKHAAAAR